MHLFRFPMKSYPCSLAGWVLLIWLCLPGHLLAQAPLYLVNPATTVDRVRFVGNRAFPDSRLQREIVTRGRSFMDRLKDRLPFMRGRRYPFNPVELQKDRRRLERFYQRHGFLDADVSYEVRLDTAINAVDITFLIHEGKPLRIQAITFSGVGGVTVDSLLHPQSREAWQTFVRQLQAHEGRQYTEALVTEWVNETLYWLKDHGYAFAEVDAEVEIDSTAAPVGFRKGVHLSMLVDPGPLTWVEQVEVVGLQRLPYFSVRKVIPLREGKLFAQGKFREGQTRLMELGVFTYVLADLPPQPRDSTVVIRYRVREALPRWVRIQGGYSTLEGTRFEGEVRHRAFLRDLRQVSLSGIWETGYGALPRIDILIPRRERLAFSYYQPVAGLPSLSLSVGPFFDRQYSSTVQEQKVGAEGNIVYTFYRFRTLRLRYSFEWTRPIGEAAERVGSRYFSRSFYVLTATVGRLDDYFYPTRGLLVRPLLEGSGWGIPSDVQYVKVAVEATRYYPLSERLGFAFRAYGGRLWPMGTTKARQNDPRVAERLRAVRFYAGGSNDVRGWGEALLGPKEVVDSLSAYYRPLGGDIKLAGNAELRWQLFERHPRWQGVVFLDAGQVGNGVRKVTLDGFKFGTGVGIRYRTPFGVLRVDIAYKINPDPEDLRPPGATKPRWWRRWALYVGIGQAF